MTETQHPRPWREIWVAEEIGEYGGKLADPQPVGIKDAADQWIVRYDDELNEDVAATMHELVRLSKAPELLRSLAQMVHQGYHGDQPGTFEDCPRTVCRAVVDFEAGDYGLPHLKDVER